MWRHGGPTQSRPSLFMQFLLLLGLVLSPVEGAFTEVCRFGEAANPGPSNLVSFGTSNPSGLRTKESLAASHGVGVWHFSETQLSSVTLEQSTKTLRAITRAQHRDVRIFAGAHAPIRPSSTWAGAYTGVLTLSDFACRPIQLEWRHQSYHTGRVQALYHFIGGVQVLTANIYGYPQGNTFSDSRARTELLLESLTHEIVLGRKGIRMICGDYNHWHESLQQTAIWKQQGWVEAQCLAQFRWQQAPVPTCKHTSHRDFIFLSPEAAALCERVRVEDIYAEHSTVIASLRLAGADRIATWPFPGEIPWKKVNVAGWRSASTPIDTMDLNSSQWLASFARGFEQSVDGHVEGSPGGKLPNRCFGRAQKFSPEVPPVVPPAKPARPGEEVATHDLLSLEVKRWYQQLRRLQSLFHAARAGCHFPAAVEHRAELWASIVRAKGFAGGFLQWWQTRPIQLQGSPRQLGRSYPGRAVCEQIFLDFRDHFRKFEAWNVRQRRAILAEQYAHNRNLIFRDLKEAAPDQVDTLSLSRAYTVLAVEEATGQVILDANMDTRGHSTWTLDGLPVQVSNVGSNTCTLSGAGSMQVDSELEQTQILSSKSDVQFEFESLWSSYWGKYAGLSASDWPRFVGFAKAFIPPGNMSLIPLSLDMWKRALRRLKPRAARGADGFARQDLLHMPDCQSQQLLQFFHELEAGRRDWPRQWLIGLVGCLKKPNERLDTQGYRPICILSLSYRLWSSIRARQMLRWLAQRMPPESLGFMPKREAAQFWWALEAQIEVACQQGEQLAGYSTDVVKAFNCLPRPPILEIAKWVGLPSGVLGPWGNFLSGLERRFVVRQCVGSPLPSSCGFPEGCALSTVGMSVVCICLHAYFEVFSTGASPRSYVDNIACVAPSVGALAGGINLTNTFLQMLGLETDHSKTYTWAVQPQQRQQLRNLQLNPLSHARELGGVFSFGRSVHNSALVSRCQDLSSLFGHLKRSASPLAVKLSVLPRKLWARALHGVSGCPLGEAHLKSLRAAATKALGIHPAGTSSLLRLSICSPPEADPGYFQLWQCVQDLRRILGKLPELLVTWQSFMAHYDGHLMRGPFSKLLAVLAQIGWRIECPPIITDEEGLSHNLLSTSGGLLKRLVSRAWLRYVANEHLHRRTMRDMFGIDVMLLHADSAQLSCLDFARLNALRSGAFVFGASHAKYDLSQTGLCALCQVVGMPLSAVCQRA